MHGKNYGICIEKDSISKLVKYFEKYNVKLNATLSPHKMKTKATTPRKRKKWNTWYEIVNQYPDLAANKLSEIVSIQKQCKLRFK